MTRVKICGLTNSADALIAAEAGADMLGFIFYPPSPRYVSPETVKSIINDQLPMTKGKRPVLVGVFVNEALERVWEILDFCGLDAAQLHGDEPPEMVAALPGRAYKALRPPSSAELEAAVKNYEFTIHHSQLPAFLLDAYHPNLYGGTGRVTDGSLAADAARRYNILLAGSLTPANVAEAVRTVNPWGVDVSSGVEAGPGRKDHAKVRAFVKNAKLY
jgi:phosphoribosylanthranilate isomerase